MTLDKPKEEGMTEAEAREIVKNQIFTRRKCEAKGILHGIKLGLNDGAVKELVAKAIQTIDGFLVYHKNGTEDARSYPILGDACMKLRKALANYEARKKESEG